MTAIRLCIVGNSHIVALKQAWHRVPQVTLDFEPTYFAAGATRLSFRVEGKTLIPSEEVAQEVERTSGGLKAIDTNDYDAFLLVGLGLGLRWVTEIYQNHRLLEHGDAKRDLISRTLFEETSYRVLADSPACIIAKQLRQITAARCLVVPEPLPSLEIATTARTAALWGGTFIPFLYDRYSEGLRRLSEDQNIEIVTPPDELVVVPCFSPVKFALGSIGLKDIEHAPNERFHMNADYGAAILPHVLSRFGGKNR